VRKTVEAPKKGRILGTRNEKSLSVEKEENAGRRSRNKDKKKASLFNPPAQEKKKKGGGKRKRIYCQAKRRVATGESSTEGGREGKRFPAVLQFKSLKERVEGKERREHQTLLVRSEGGKGRRQMGHRKKRKGGSARFFEGRKRNLSQQQLSEGEVPGGRKSPPFEVFLR